MACSRTVLLFLLKMSLVQEEDFNAVLTEDMVQLQLPTEDPVSVPVG
jgi:hypothetical protein